MIPAAGQLVGPYEILGRLGRGGMGLVFSAWDSRLHRDVAIKLLREEFVRGDSHERFLTEARAASGLNHPNICTIFDIGEQDGDPYLVMELLKGETLRSRIISGPMSLEEILSVGREIADALTAAHARGIIHRDIKPANIFLVAKPVGGWQTKVLDFGLAKVDLPDGLDPRYQITGHGSAIGTVAYMSPEQARGEVLDVRSDLFALGIVLYEMATGHAPFEGVTSALIFVQLLSQQPEPIRELHPGFPKDFERVILKLLAKDRSERFQSAAELLDALRKIDLKKPAARLGLFNKPVMPWTRNSMANASAAKAVSSTRGDPLSSDNGGSTGHPSDSSKPSGEALTIRPIRRQPLPPTEFPATAAHWVRPPRLSGITAAAESSGSHAVAVPLAETTSSTVSSASRSGAVGKTQKVSATFSEFESREKDLLSGPSKWFWVLVAAAAFALLLAAVVYFRNASKPFATHRAETLVLASIENHSDDKMLNGVVAEGLRLDLAQSPHITVPDAVATAGATRSAGVVASDAASLSDAGRIVKVLKATDYLAGEVRNESSNYVVSVQIYNAATGAAVAQAEETAGSREQITDAIDRLSAQIRIDLGESGDAVSHTSVPLGRDATSNIDALEAYVAGTEAEAGGHSLDAIAALRHAVALEPKFTQGWLELADLYRAEHAEVAAADAATHAQEASVGASDRTKLLAAASFQLNATDDYPHALGFLDQISEAYPLDVSIGAKRALLLRAQGEFPEALEASQETLARNPYDLEASAQAEYAMLALDRGQAAAHLEAQTEQRGQRHPEAHILLASLNLTDGSAAVQGAESNLIGAQVYRAQMLDATGQLAAGLIGWRAVGTTAHTTPVLASATAEAFAQAALDHALMSDCVSSATLANDAAALPRGQTALFDVGMAQGLCGDLNGTRNAVLALMAQYPQSFAVKHYYLADLTAIDQIRSDDTDSALATLQLAKPYDLLSLTPYLRALAHSKSKQWPMAIDDFQFVSLHRGAATLHSAPMYAMSQLGLARAYAANGDKRNSVIAYNTFLEMWKAADPANALVAEAHKHVR